MENINFLRELEKLSLERVKVTKRKVEKLIEIIAVVEDEKLKRNLKEVNETSLKVFEKLKNETIEIRMDMLESVNECLKQSYESLRVYERLSKKIVIQDKYNPIKTWEITKLKGGYYLKQFISGKQFGSGIRTTKKWLENTLEIKIS
ncbi:hypothetical protein SAMN02745174_02512 [Cetobacterium ceti]|uniref:Uncharacterized protein n=1 Tax=Cetobacterium ceti TaxID=180163 RepID=A0A1T4QZ93_9FUSO|nr:hypothetical protein [Cetobacterium ceti]SKA08781.1 hypothetical protein SAMN02745174_02512 [Cetobacterium ceti]